MRTLSATLLAAQKAASGTPYVRTVVQNTIRNVRHLLFAETFSNADPDDEHGAAGDSTYLHRVRVRAGRPQYERRTAGEAAGWTDLNALNDSAVIAIAAVNNARVIVVYNRGAALYFRESTDQGATFGSETLIVSLGATPKAVAVAYKNTSGDLAAFWEESSAVKRIRRTAGAFGAVSTWTQSANSVNGLAVAYSGDFLLVVTGTDTSSRPTLWSLILGDGASWSVDTWAAFYVQNQAEADEQITFQAPSIAVIDTTRITFVEKFSGTPAYTRTYWTLITPAATYGAGNWEWMDPVPLNNTTEKGYAITKRGSAPSTAVLSRPAQIIEASSASVTKDMSPDLIEASVEERDGVTQRAELVFDNSSGQYAGPPAPIVLHHDIDLGLGYDANFSRPPAQSIVGWEYRRLGGKSVFVLRTRGNDYWLSLSRARTAIVDTRKMVQIARAAAARAGIDFLNSGSSARANNLSIEWTVHPDQSQLDVLRALIELYPDVLLTFSVGSLLITEPLASEAIDYTYGTDHAIYELRASSEQAASFAEILAAGALGQAFDFAVMNQDKPAQDRRRDPHDSTAADANAAATARLRKAVLESDKGQLLTPPNCGLEVGDVVAYSDGHVASGQQKARVTGISTRFRRRDSSPLYEQTVSLGGV